MRAVNSSFAILIDQQRYKYFWNTGYRMVNSVMKCLCGLGGGQEAITCVNIEDIALNQFQTSTILLV